MSVYPPITEASSIAASSGLRSFTKLKNKVYFQFVILGSPVEDCRASNGEGHHDDEVGEEGKGAEDQVGLGSKAGLDDLHKHKILLAAFGPCNHLVKCTVALFVATEPI